MIYSMDRTRKDIVRVASYSSGSCRLLQRRVPSLLVWLFNPALPRGRVSALLSSQDHGVTSHLGKAADTLLAVLVKAPRGGQGGDRVSMACAMDWNIPN